jgi:hypothetical protein
MERAGRAAQSGTSRGRRSHNRELWNDERKPRSAGVVCRTGFREGADLQCRHRESAGHRVNGTSIMPVEWERIPDGVPEDFQALDGDEIVGRVYQIPHGPERGLWFWTMTVVRPGPRITFPRSGTEARRGDAGRRVVEAYERLMRRKA